MISRLFVIACASAVGACAARGAASEAVLSAVSAAPPTATEIVARGNEPGWRVEIGADETSFILDYGERRFQSPTPAPVLDASVQTYVFAREGVALAIADAPCADDATGMPFPKTATLSEGNNILNGCAGDPRDILTGGEWVVEDIEMAGVIDSSRATLEFSADGRVAGRGSCNRYGASYELTGEGLTIGRAMATKMACAPALMVQEQKFFNALARIDRFEIDETGALLLFGGDKRLILARR